MSDLTDFAAAFAELKRTVQPDVDPTLTYGDGVTPNPAMELDAVLLAARRAQTWAADATANYGSVWMPTVRNGRRYEVIKAGVLGEAEPSVWPDYDGGTVESGTATLREAGVEYGNVYDVRAAKYAACELKESKSSDRIDYSADGRSFHEHQTPQYWAGRKKAYRSVGVG